MITLKDFMQTVDYKITDCSKYEWDCYGQNASSMTADTEDGYQASTVCIVFDTVDQTVYEMEAWDYNNNREYRWIHPDYVKAHKKEAKKNGSKHRDSFDGRKFIDLEEVEDILEKSRAIFHDEEYDTRIIVPLTLSAEEEVQLMKMAHENDMSVNQYIEYILQQEIERVDLCIRQRTF